MNPLQRASRNRKIIYFAVIIGLFTISMVWRGVIPVPLGSSTARAAQPFRWAAAHTIQNQADRLEVWELDEKESEAELSGSAMRLALTGSRGFVVTALWLSAIEKQKRNDFHEFEQRVEAVTKLQPNFITPWIFQSWNITYNVSVEMHGSGDMYYYIARGIELLAEGERRNKRSPDMRYQIAFYYQNKFGVADNVETLRCLFDLSCIPPSKRDPKSLLRQDGSGKVDEVAFERFCREHPHLVRRLRGEDSHDPRREKLRCETPEEIIRFLRDNWDIPCRYKKDTDGKLIDDLADRQNQFPALPPQFDEGPDEAHPGIATETDEAPVVGYFSAFKAARAWFSYSLLLLPPNPTDLDGKPIPGPTPPPGVGGYDPFKHRVPRLPMMIIFRQGAPRAQSYAAELEQKEGWFDSDGWQIDVPGASKVWFPNRPEPVVVGKGREWSLIEWERARDMWQRHGDAYGLILGDREAAYRNEVGDLATLPQDPSPEQMADETFRRRYVAQSALYYFRSYRMVTNFPYFLNSSQAEAQRETVAARKTLWQADRAYKLYDLPRAIALYKRGLEQWKQVLAANPRFHRDERSDKTEEETYEYEYAYLKILVEHDPRVWARANLLVAARRDYLIARGAPGLVPFIPTPFRPTPGDDPVWQKADLSDLKWYVVETVGDADFSSPLVGSSGFDPETRLPVPWVRNDVKQMVKAKHGVGVMQPGQGQPQQPGQPPAPKR